MNDPFQQVSTTRQNVLGDAEQARAVAETQAAMVIAKRFPRNEVAALDRIKNACTRPTLAASALYTYSRGGSEISGPSIRLAEVLAQAWGNLVFGIRELEQRDGESTVETFAWDVETNTRQTKTFQVRHERHTKKAVVKLSDSRDIYELIANQGARRLRACILGIIPGDIVEEAVAQCDVTMRTKLDVTQDAVEKMLEKFAALNVKKEQIEKRIQRRIESILPAQLISLRKIYNSIKDGMSKPEEWFEPLQSSQPSGAAPNFSASESEIKGPGGGEKSKVLSEGVKASDVGGTPAPVSVNKSADAADADGPGTPPQFVAKSIQEKLALALADLDFPQTRFVAGLKALGIERVPKKAATVHDLPDDVCDKVFGDGLDNVVALMEAGK